MPSWRYEARRFDRARKIMGEFAIGQSVLRREDPRLLQGRGRFFDDLKLADQLHAAIVRSPHAHADITGMGMWRAHDSRMELIGEFEIEIGRAHV